MPDLEALRHTLAVVEELQSIVHTMKALAAASIRQYEKAVTALADYDRAVQWALAVMLREFGNGAANAVLEPATPCGQPWTGIIVFGSDHGLCGRFNEVLATYVAETLRIVPTGCRRIAAVGLRQAAALEEQGLPPEQQFHTPVAASAIQHTVRQLLLVLEQWRQVGVTDLRLCYNRHRDGSSHEPACFTLLPLDFVALYGELPAASRSLPGYAADRAEVLAALLREWFFVELFRVCAESLASEHASRLLAMQTAERNISDRLAALNTAYGQQRQEAITSELLDVVAGFEALTGSRSAQG